MSKFESFFDGLPVIVKGLAFVSLCLVGIAVLAGISVLF